MDYVLKPLKNAEGKPFTLSSDPTGEIIELSPDQNVKYVFALNIGDLPPLEASEYVKKAMKNIITVLGPDRTLVIPRRSDEGSVLIYELEAVPADDE